MNTPLESIPQQSYALVSEQTPPPAPDQDHPSWSVLTALLVWLSSILLLALVQSALVFGYLGAVKLAGAFGVQMPQMDQPTLLLLAVIATLPAHLLTLWLVWAVVTRRGKDSFRGAVGLYWNEASRYWTRARGAWVCAAIALSMFVCGGVLTKMFPGGKTFIDDLVTSSDASRLLIAFIATFTAPLVEELVYRGMMYPAFKRWIGETYAILFVTLMFAAVHVPQYITNYAVIGATVLLGLVITLVRAKSGRLLPCVLIHMIFNGVQAAILIALPYLPPSFTDPNTPPQAASTIILSVAGWLKIFS